MLTSPGRTKRERGADFSRLRAGHVYGLVVAFAIALGFVLRAPGLEGRLVSDDWDHYAMATGVFPVALSPFDLFNFVPDDDGARAALRGSGRLPWWSDPQIHLGFLRPLASIFTYADFAVLHAERVPARAHWHSFVWWAASVAGVALVLIRVLTLPAASVGVLLYAVDDAFALPVAWSASRSELISITLMTLALAAHLDWLRTRQTRSRWLVSVLVWLGMLSGEYALSLFALIVACELAATETPLRERVRSLAPLAVAPALYVLARAALGYGARGSEFYFDPFAEPLRYAKALLTHVPLLAGDLTWGYRADYWFGAPPWRAALLELDVVPVAWLAPVQVRAVQWCLGALAIGALVWFWRQLRSSADPSARALRWLVAGALLSLLPLASAIPMSRLVAGPSLAIHALFAWITVEAARRLTRGNPLRLRAAAAIACGFVLLVHGWNAASTSRAFARSYADSTQLEQDWLLHSPIDPAKLGGTRAFVLSTHDLVTQMSLPYFLRSHDRPAPRSSAILLPGVRVPFRVTRPSANTLELRMFSADALSDLRLSAYRRADSDFDTSQRFRGAGFEVQVIAAIHGLPTALRFEFPRPLEDPDYVFLYPWPEGLRALDPPPIGHTRQLPPPALPYPR